MEKHEVITASDKDIKIVIEQMCNFVTVDAINASGLGMKYEATELARLADSVETIREDQFLEDIFGSMSRLDSEIFIKQVQQSGAYVFNASELRGRLLEAADLPLRY